MSLRTQKLAKADIRIGQYKMIEEITKANDKFSFKIYAFIYKEIE